MDAGSRPSVHEQIKFWERKMIEIRVGALASTFDDSTEGIQMLGGSQQPIVDLVETTITTDAEHTFYSYPDLVDILRKVPPYYFGVAEKPVGRPGRFTRPRRFYHGSCPQTRQP